MAGIVAIIGADTSGLDDAVKSSKTQLKSLSTEMGKNITQAAKYGAAMVAAGAALGLAMTVKGLAAVDAQAKLARQLGGTIDGLRALQLAASDAGVSAGVMSSAMEKLNSRVGEAQRGTGTAADSFERLGVSASDLATMDIDERMAFISDAMQGAGLSTNQMADELRQMGIRNGEVINLMLSGGDAIRGYRQEVEDLGLSISDFDAAKVEAANDAFSRVGMTVEAVQNRLAISFAKTIDDVSDLMVKEFSRGGKSLGDGVEDAVDIAVRGLADFMDGAASVIDFVTNNPVLSQFGLLGFVFFGPKGKVITAAIGLAFQLIHDELAKFGIGISDAEEVARRLLNIQEDIAKQQEIINKAREVGQKDDSPFIVQAQEEIKSLSDLESQLKKTVEGSSEAQEEFNRLMNAGTVNANSLTGALRRFSEQMRNSREESEQGLGDVGGGGLPEGEGGEGGGLTITFTDEEKLAIAEKLEAIRQSNLTEEALLKEKQAAEIKLIEESNEAKLGLDIDYKQLQKDAEARHLEELVELNRAAEEQKTRDKDEAERKRVQLVGQAAAAEKSLRLAVVQNAMNLLGTLLGDNKAFAVASIAITKGLAIAQTLAHTQTASMLAFSSQLIPGDPSSLARAGIAAAKTKALGYASAGLIAATGLAEAHQATSGGGGSSVSSASGGGTAGGTTGTTTEPAVPTETLVANINVTGQTFDRKTVIGLMEQIDELQSDGMRVRLVTA